MPEVQISAKVGKEENSPSATVNMDIPDTVKGLTDKYGEDVVYSRARSALVIDAQALIRSQIKAEKKPVEIQAALDSWEPGVKAKGKSARERAEDAIGKLTDEEKAELFKAMSGKKK